jgi:hypothetical protein
MPCGSPVHQSPVSNVPSDFCDSFHAKALLCHFGLRLRIQSSWLLLLLHIRVICSVFIFCRRDNGLGARGWEAILNALEKCTRLESLNGCDQYQDILKGCVVELDAANCDIANALTAGQFLSRSASSLTSLDFRCGKRCSSIVARMDSVLAAIILQ